MGFIRVAKEQIMGVIDVAKSAGINSINDSKYKEAVVLPEHVSSDALAVKGTLLTKDPDGISRQGNQHTGLLTDGSVVIVPQGYVAILVNNGTFLGDILEAGSHEWRSGDNAWLLEKGELRALGKTSSTAFHSLVKSLLNKKSSLSRVQPITGNKFGTQNAVEYFSERYQQLLNIRFYGYLISRFLIQSFSTLAQSVNRLKNINHLHSKILLKELFDKISLLKLLSQFPNSLMSTELISIA